MAEKILIVDDDRDIRVGLNVRLRKLGYETCFAEDGVSATAAIKQEKPNLVLLDIGLPAGDGFLVLERMNDSADAGCTPVIVLTARDPEETEKRALDAGAYAYFQKPVGTDELLGSIREALDARSS